MKARYCVWILAAVVAVVPVFALSHVAASAPTQLAFQGGHPMPPPPGGGAVAFQGGHPMPPPPGGGAVAFQGGHPMPPPPGGGAVQA